MKNKISKEKIIFSLDSEKAEVEGQSLMDVKEIKTPYETIKRLLKIKKENYNLYIIDSFFKEKINSLVELVREEYKLLEAPMDICYASLGSGKPFPIEVGNGKGKSLKVEIIGLKEGYKEAIFSFNSAEYTEEKDELVENLQVNRSKYLNKLVSLASEEGFDMKATSDGFVFIPLEEDGSEMSETNYDKLDERIKEELLEKADRLKEESEEILKKLKELETKSSKRIREILEEYLEEVMKEVKDDILLEYILDDDVYNYLENFYRDLERELIETYSIDVEEGDKDILAVLEKYVIEVIVDNEEYNHPRVIYEENPTIAKLLGNIEYESQNGNYTTDLTLISGGTLLEANGGAVIIRLKDLIETNAYSYLKKALQLGKITFDINRSYLEVLSINGLKVEPAKFNVKVILLGDYESYNILYNHDEDFKELFPVRVEMPREIKLKNKLSNMITFIEEINRKVNKLPLNKKASNSIIKKLVRDTGNRGKIAIEYKEIEKILLISEQFSYEDFKEEIGKEEVDKVIYSEDEVEKEYREMYKEGKVFIHVKEKIVGNINGLAVLGTGLHSFGKPLRITCKAFKGEGYIYDLHKEAKLSGKIHEKSIGIIKSILWSKLDKREKMPFNLYLSFEQSYGLIEGDSATVAEMICILSAITGKGIRQNIAVTGSLNQFGEVQPIGGVNEKIEGFFYVCKELDSIEEKGVLIPNTNIDELILKDEVEQAIGRESFTLYEMKTLDDAIEVLMLEEGETVEDFYNLLKEEVGKFKR